MHTISGPDREKPSPGKCIWTSGHMRRRSDSVPWGGWQGGRIWDHEEAEVGRGASAGREGKGTGTVVGEIWSKKDEQSMNLKQVSFG